MFVDVLMCDSVSRLALCSGFRSPLTCVSVQQVSTSRPGGENPGHRPERVQHGRQSGADTAEQRGARKR